MRSPIIAALLLCPLAGAQLLVYPRTETDVSVFADDGSKIDLKFKPKQTLLIMERLDVVAGNKICGGMWWRPILTNRGIRIREFVYVQQGANAKANGGSTTATSTTGLKQGPHSFLISVRGRATSNLILMAAGFKSGNGKAKIDVDIDANNTIDYTHTVGGPMTRRTMSFRGGAPRNIRVTIDVSASATATGANSVDFTFYLKIENPIKGGCFFARFGKPCDPMTLGGFDATGQANQHDLFLNATSGPATKPAILILGATRLTIPIFANTCPLYTLPLLTLGNVSNNNGDASWNLKLPFKLNLRGYWQVVMLDTGGPRFSNGLLMDCFDK